MSKLLPVAILALLFAASAGAQDKPAAKGKPAAAEEVPQDKVLNGDAKCTACHDENDGNVLLIGKTKHGTRADKRTPTCTSCHGESDAHMKKPAAGSSRAKPDVSFSKVSKTPPEVRGKVCLTCHQGGARIDWHLSAHANRDVECSSCHVVHSGHDPVRDKVTQMDTCFTCHKEQRAQVNRPVHHPVVEGLMACSACHNVHNGTPKQLVRDTVNETCFTCHAEKRGPFVNNHPPVQENCAICHEPHGTSIASLLRSRPPFLCQECHSHTSHPSQAGALPGGRTTSSSLLGTVGRGCMTCHINIHGSNSTENKATAGRFRR